MAEINTHAGNVRLIGGRLCLNFVNTADDHASACPKEYWVSYAALVAWSAHAGMLDASATTAVLAEAARRLDAADAALSRAKLLRGALYRIFSAAPAGQPIAASDLAALNDALAGSPRRPQLLQAPAGLTWAWGGGDPLERVIWPAAWSAADLLTSAEIAAVRGCAGEGCGWLFVDTSRNRSRRWCSMEDCGNRAKARRHYTQRRAAVESADSAVERG
ncbi:MAG TPA: ABATE domain-containing protein [Roseiflexaceae bacterium]